MKVEICQKSLDRLGAEQGAFMEALREREHTPVAKDCLNRCQGCQLGLLIVTVDGAPMSKRTPAAFLEELDELAADEA
jgi:hypothetical protein